MTKKNQKPTTLLVRRHHILFQNIIIITTILQNCWFSKKKGSAPYMNSNSKYIFLLTRKNANIIGMWTQQKKNGLNNAEVRFNISKIKKNGRTKKPIHDVKQKKKKKKKLHPKTVWNFDHKNESWVMDKRNDVLVLLVQKNKIWEIYFCQVGFSI